MLVSYFSILAFETGGLNKTLFIITQSIGEINPYVSYEVPVKNANALASIRLGIILAKNEAKFRLKNVFAIYHKMHS